MTVRLSKSEEVHYLAHASWCERDASCHEQGRATVELQGRRLVHDFRLTKAEVSDACREDRKAGFPVRPLVRGTRSPVYRTRDYRDLVH